MCPRTKAFGRCVPWMMCSLDDESHAKLPSPYVTNSVPIRDVWFGDATSKGRIVQGKHLPRTLIRGYIDRGRIQIDLIEGKVLVLLVTRKAIYRQQMQPSLLNEDGKAVWLVLSYVRCSGGETKEMGIAFLQSWAQSSNIWHINNELIDRHRGSLDVVGS